MGQFISMAMSFYTKAYPSRPWVRICAVAHTENGEKWVTRKGMSEAGRADMWYIDRRVVHVLSRDNRAFWRPLFADEHQAAADRKEL